MMVNSPRADGDRSQLIRLLCARKGIQKIRVTVNNLQCRDLFKSLLGRKEKGKIRPMSVLCKGRAATDLTQNAWVSRGLERKKDLITNPIHFDLGDDFVHAVREQSKQESIYPFFSRDCQKNNGAMS